MKHSLTYNIITIISFVFVVCGCSDNNCIDELDRINSVIEENPKEGLLLIDSVDTSGFNQKEMAFFNLLRVKARDKNFIRHTSDKEISVALDYYTNHRGSLYPEVLYYAARVYTDIGDRPGALRYYQSALENVPEDDYSLRSKILVHTGWVLNSMRMNKQAVPYLVDAIKIDRLVHDTLNTMYDLQVLGGILINLKQFDKAERIIDEAREIAKQINPQYLPLLDVYLAKTKYKQKDFKTALNLIRPTVRKVDFRDMHMSLTYATLIYKENGILDTALMYARELINLEDHHINQKTGYEVILSPELVEYSDKDSLLLYVDRYRVLIEEHLKRNGDNAALIQNSLYNYSIHDKARAESEKQSGIKTIIIMAMGIAVFGLIILYLLWRIRSKNQQLQLHKALELVETLKSENENKERMLTEMSAKTDETESSIREKLKKNVLELLKATKNNTDSLATIKDTETYRCLTGYIEDERVIPNDSELWSKIDKMITESYPEFKSRLAILSEGRLTKSDYRLALLIKCGLKQGQTALLMGRTKSTMTARRHNLCSLILDDNNNGLKMLDQVIAVL